MVQVINDPYGKGKLGASVGAAFGQGLADQIPKEIERNRLASGLEKLSQDSGNLSQFQKFARLASLPGSTPQIQKSGADLLMQEGIRGAGPVSSSKISNPKNSNVNDDSVNLRYSPTKDEQTQNQNLSNKNNNLEKLTKTYDDKFRSLTNVEDVQNSHYPVKSEEEKEERAYQLWNDYPKRFPGGLNDARQKVDSELNSEREAFESRKQKRLNDIGLENTARTTFDSKLNGDLPQEIQNTFEQKAIDDIASGKKTPEQAGKTRAAEANDFIKLRDTLKTLGATPLTKAPEQTVRELKRMRDSYKELDALPIFVQDMINYNGLGEHMASSIGYPLSDELNKSIPNINNVNKKFIDSKKAIEEMAKNFGPEDSFFSLGLALEDAGWNADEAMKTFINMVDKNKLRLSKYQEKELASYTPLNYTLGDIFLSHFTDLISNKKVPTKEKIRRTWYGKR